MSQVVADSAASIENARSGRGPERGESRNHARFCVHERLSKHERPLTASRQLAIDLDQDLRIQQRAVPDPS